MTVEPAAPGALLPLLARESAAFARAVQAGDPALRVPSCPEWTLADLAWHVIAVQSMWTAIATGAADPGEVVPLSRPADDRLVAALRDGSGHLVETLRTRDPLTRAWTWAGPRDLRWVVRRMTHEAAVHRWDAQAAVGAPEPLDPIEADDGVAEVCQVFVGASSATGQPGIELVCTDTGSTHRLWPGQPTATVRGAAGEVLLALWQRVAVGDLVVDGDPEVVTSAVEAVFAHD